MAGLGRVCCKDPVLRQTEGTNMRKPANMRRNEQAAHQRAYRAQQNAMRKPSRDDVARCALHMSIKDTLRRGQDAELAAWCQALVAQLITQGFDGDAAHRRVDVLIDSYANGWDFQRKPHLDAVRTG